MNSGGTKITEGSTGLCHAAICVAVAEIGVEPGEGATQIVKPGIVTGLDLDTAHPRRAVHVHIGVVFLAELGRLTVPIEM